MRMQVILDSLFARPGSAPMWGGRKESSGTGLGASWLCENWEERIGLQTLATHALNTRQNQDWNTLMSLPWVPLC